MYPSQPPQQPYPQPDPNQQGYAQSPYGQPPYVQPPYAPQPGAEAYGMPPNPYAPPSTPMQPPYGAPPSVPMQPPNPYANPYAPPSMPMQQPPYGAPMPPPNTLNFNLFTLPQNRGYLFAAAGGVVAVLSFFIFDFWGVSAAGRSENYKATDFTGGQLQGFNHSYPLLWLVPLAALAAAIVASMIVLGIRSIQGLTPRNAAISITAASAIGVACLLLTVLQFNGDFNSELNGVNLSSLGISSGYGLGFWLTLLALLAALGGGILNLRQTQPVYSPPPPPPMYGGYPPQNPPM